MTTHYYTFFTLHKLRLLPTSPITTSPITQIHDLKRRNRKKSGTGSLNKSLKTILADTPLVRNLENEDYLRIILDGCNSLEERFEKIESRLVLKELKRTQKTSERIPPEMKKIIKEPNLPQKIIEIFID